MILVALLAPFAFVQSLHFTLARSDLVAILAASWGVSGALFALTAAITAVLVNVASEPRLRSRIVYEYRRKGFDAAALLSLFVLIWTGVLVVSVAATQTRDGMLAASQIGYQLASWSVLLVIDIVALGWLLIYSHRLLSRSPEQQLSIYRDALQEAFRNAALSQVADAVLRTWGTNHGLETDMTFGFAANGVPVLAPRSGRVRDINLGALSWSLSRMRGRIRGTTRAQLGISLGTAVTSGLQIASIPPLDAVRSGQIVNSILWE